LAINDEAFGGDKKVGLEHFVFEAARDILSLYLPYWSTIFSQLGLFGLLYFAIFEAPLGH
jgi:hypothetical protein